MTRRHLGIAGTVLCAGLSVLTLSACVVSVNGGQFAVRDERTFDVTGAPDLSLTTFDGSIEVRSWDRGQVRIEIEKRGANREAAEAIDVQVEQSGNRITLEVKKPAGPRTVLNPSASARIVATVPRHSNLVAWTGDGSVSLERLDGKIDVTTGDGSLRGTELKGTIRARTGDGSVRFTDIDGAVDLDTGDGGATVRGRLNGVRIETGDGTVNVIAEDGSAMSDAWEIRTGDGGVLLEIPERFGAALDAHTSDGSIRVDGLGAPERPEDRDEGGSQDLKRPLGAGGKLLRLRSSSGSITVRRL